MVGYYVGDQYFLRVKPRRRTKFTDSELANQAKFKLVQTYLDPLKDMVKVGFAGYFTKTGGYRAAVAYTRKQALITDEQGFRIDHSLLKISGGDLLQLIAPGAVVVAANQLKIFWDSSGLNVGNRSDQVMFAVYDTLNFKAITKIYDGVQRKDGEILIEIPPPFKNLAVHIYVGVVAADRSAQSDSQYLGMLDLTYS